MGLYAFLPMWLAIARGPAHRIASACGARCWWARSAIALGASLPRVFPGLPALFATTALVGVSFMLFQVAAQNATGEIGAPEERAKNFSLLALGYSRLGLRGPLVAGLADRPRRFRDSLRWSWRCCLWCLPSCCGRARWRCRVRSRSDAARPRAGSPSCCAIGDCGGCSPSTGCLPSPGTCTRSSSRSTARGSACRHRASAVILAAFAAATFVVRLVMPPIVRRLHRVRGADRGTLRRGLRLLAVPVRGQPRCVDGARRSRSGSRSAAGSRW